MNHNVHTTQVQNKSISEKVQVHCFSTCLSPHDESSKGAPTLNSDAWIVYIYCADSIQMCTVGYIWNTACMITQIQRLQGAIIFLVFSTLKY